MFPKKNQGENISTKNNGSANGNNGALNTIGRIEHVISLIKNGLATQELIEKLDQQMSCETRLKQPDKRVRERLFDLQLLIDSHLVGKNPLAKKRADLWKQPRPRNTTGQYLRI